MHLEYMCALYASPFFLKGQTAEEHKVSSHAEQRTHNDVSNGAALELQKSHDGEGQRSD